MPQPLTRTDGSRHRAVEPAAVASGRSGCAWHVRLVSFARGAPWTRLCDGSGMAGTSGAPRPWSSRSSRRCFSPWSSGSSSTGCTSGSCRAVPPQLCPGSGGWNCLGAQDRRRRESRHQLPDGVHRHAADAQRRHGDIAGTRPGRDRHRREPTVRLNRISHRRDSRSEDGVVAVVVAICSLLLLSVAALAVDMGNAWTQTPRGADRGRPRGPRRRRRSAPWWHKRC